jgi:hypothetical protein
MARYRWSAAEKCTVVFGWTYRPKCTYLLRQLKPLEAVQLLLDATL